MTASPGYRFVGVTVLVTLIGCGPAPTATGPKSASPTVAFAQMGAESDWRVAETKSIRGEADRRRIDLKFADAQGSQENQIKAVRAFLAQKVGVLVIAPKTETGWEPVLREAKKANVPVVLVDRGVNVADDSLYATLIASDFVDEGRRAGEWLAKKLGGKGAVVELQGTTGAAPAIDRKRGFDEAIQKFSDIKVAKSQSGDFTRSKGKEVMEAFLKGAKGENLTINAVYAHNDDMAIGAIQAIEEAGMKPGSDVIVVSIDAGKGAFEAMAAGKLNCAVECNPLLGPMVFDAVEKLRKGEAVPKKTVVTDQLFEAAQAKDLIAGRQY